MEPRAGGPADDTVAGMIFQDAQGSFYAIAWEDLRRFRVPEAYANAVAALVHGAEPAPAPLDVTGHALQDPAVPEGFLSEALVAAADPRSVLAARRLAAWAVLR